MLQFSECALYAALAYHVCLSPVNPHVTIREAQRIFTKYGTREFNEILSARSDGD